MSKSVLIVDDCPFTRKLVSLYLTGQGYDLIQAEDGLEALEQLARKPADLVITDINMPHMDGLALTRALKGDSTYRHIPVVMLTTETAEKERDSSLQAGASRYLTKPISQGVLAAEVQTLLQGVRP
jgi:two-component system chemotaxis response regulator CheY